MESTSSSPRRPTSSPSFRKWRERSPLLFSEGSVSVYHFDPYSQALSKIECGFKHDLSDVAALIARELVDPWRLRELYEAIEPELYGYPAINPPRFRRKLNDALRES